MLVRIRTTTLVAAFVAVAALLCQALAAEAVSTYSRDGKTGRIAPAFRGSIFETQRAKCLWRASDVAQITIPPMLIWAAGHRRHRVERIYVKYVLKRSSSPHGPWHTATSGRWEHGRLRGSGEFRYLEFRPGGQPLVVKPARYYSVWIKGRWYKHPNNWAWIGSKTVYFDDGDFKAVSHSGSPIVTDTDGGVGWCYFDNSVTGAG